MNSKITLPEIIAALSENSGKSRAVCERFIKSLLSTVGDTLVLGENVKIKGLGTFKVSNVEERKSVNVNTGAEMIIPGHRKVTFSPDKVISEAVNEAFSIFEPVELEDKVTEQMLDVQEDMPAPEPIATEPAAPAPEAPLTEAPEQPAEPTAESEPDPDPWQEAVEEQFSEPMPKPAPEPEPAPEVEQKESAPAHEPDPWLEAVEEQFSEPAPEPTPAEPEATPPTPPAVVEETPSVSEEKETVVPPPPVREPVYEPEEEEPKISSEELSHVCRAPGFAKGIWIGIAAAVIIVFAIVAAWRIFLPESFCSITGTRPPLSTTEQLTKASVPAKEYAKAPQAKPDTLSESERIKPVEAKQDDKDLAPTQASDTEKKEEQKAEAKPKKVYDTISRTRFLTTMAKEHYGDYNLWPFIYDENKAILGHPDRIRPGTRVVIPPAEKYGINASDPACIAKAKKRGAAIYARYRK